MIVTCVETLFCVYMYITHTFLKIIEIIQIKEQKNGIHKKIQSY